MMHALLWLQIAQLGIADEIGASTSTACEVGEILLLGRVLAVDIATRARTAVHLLSSPTSRTEAAHRNGSKEASGITEQANVTAWRLVVRS